MSTLRSTKNLLKDIEDLKQIILSKQRYIHLVNGHMTDKDYQVLSEYFKTREEILQTLTCLND